MLAGEHGRWSLRFRHFVPIGEARPWNEPQPSPEPAVRRSADAVIFAVSQTRLLVVDRPGVGAAPLDGAREPDGVGRIEMQHWPEVQRFGVLGHLGPLFVIGRCATGADRR
ncbi:unannotated protein [freshwater metagenome]|uniref:Unannotated protein n=1 Tax=freshwater metagenome TaxID=449393 RepID=A0A6J6X3A5_9ZZZZ